MELKYSGQNLTSVVGVSKNSLGEVVGGDTILFYRYTDLKNPIKKQKFINKEFFYSISENTPDTFRTSYGYTFLTSGVPTSVLSGWSTYKVNYTDNGKGYPKEVGTYKCD